MSKCLDEAVQALHAIKLRALNIDPEVRWAIESIIAHCQEQEIIATANEAKMDAALHGFTELIAKQEREIALLRKWQDQLIRRVASMAHQ